MDSDEKATIIGEELVVVGEVEGWGRTCDKKIEQFELQPALFNHWNRDGVIDFTVDLNSLVNYQVDCDGMVFIAEVSLALEYSAIGGC